MLPTISYSTKLQTHACHVAARPDKKFKWSTSKLSAPVVCSFISTSATSCSYRLLNPEIKLA